MSSPLRRLLVLACILAAFLAGAGRARAAATVDVTGTTFAAAGGVARTYMDVGAVWNGTARVDTGGSPTGDVFTVTFRNAGPDTAFDFRPIIGLPANFTRIGAITVAASSGTPAISGTPGTSGTININLNGYDLPAGQTVTLTFRLKTEIAVVPGTHDVNYRSQWADTNGGTLNAATASSPRPVLVQAGAYVAEATPAKLTLQVNATGTYTYTVTNTGLGGLFNLTFSEVASNPGAAWDFTSFNPAPTLTPGALASGAPTVGGAGNAIVTVPYLAPGASVTIPVRGVVTACLNIRNDYTINHLAGSAVAAFTPIELDLTKPLLTYALPDINLNYGAVRSVTVPLQNTGNGSALGVTVSTNLHTFPLTIAPGTGWTYNSSTGVFTRTTSSGTIANGASANLLFTAIATNACAAQPSGTYLATARYTDACGNTYALPTQLASINPPSVAPSLRLQNTVAAGAAVGLSGTYTLTASAENVSLISTTELVVTDVVPAGLVLGAVNPSAGSVDPIVGNTVVWRVPVSQLGTARTLTIAFTTSADPCDGGNNFTNTASTNTLLTTAGCDLSATASVTLYVSNFGASGTISSSFALDGAPANGDAFETGVADDGDATRELALGEGEFIPVLSTYTISANYAGTWAGSTYRDDFAGLSSARRVPGTVEVSVDGGAWTAVPPAAITSAASAGELAINLGFLSGSGFFNDPSVGGAAIRTLAFRYRLTVADANLGGAGGAFVTQRATLSVAGGVNSCSGGDYTQWLLYNLARASAGVSLSMPASLDLCEEFTATLGVSRANDLDARNVRVALDTGAPGSKYDYLGIAGYTGIFNAGNITPVVDGNGNVTFTYSGTLTGNGGLILRLTRKQTSGVIDVATTPALTATLTYDDRQTAPAGARVFGPQTATASPVIVRSANLALLATPQNVNVIERDVSWTAFLTNTGNGPAYNSFFTITYPDGITPSPAATLAAGVNAANTGLALTAADVVIAGQVVTIDFGTIASGAQRKIPLSGTLAGNECAFNSVANAMVGRWGCGLVTHTRTVANPTFVQAPAAVQVVHDTTASRAELCSDSTITIILRNVGLPTVYDLIVTESLGTPAATGVAFIAGSVEVSLNGGAFTALGAAGNPTGPGSNPAGGVLVWDKNDIAALANLAGATNPGGGTHTLRIRFGISTGEVANSGGPSILASYTGTLPCGSPASSPGTAYALPVRKPSITVNKTGINRTAAGGGFGTGSFDETVYAGVGDVVEWRVEIANSGNLAARNVRLRDLLSGSAPTAVAIKTSAGVNVDAAYVSGDWVNLPDIPAGSTVTYYVVETLGPTCVATASPQASVTWGCVAAPANTASTLSSPSDNTDAATLVMRGTFTAGTGSITQSTTALSNGRLRQVVTLLNGGGTIKNLSLNLTLTNGLVIDTSVAPVITGANTTAYTGVTLDNTTPAAPVLTFTPAATANAMRFGQTVQVTLYYLPAIAADLTANPASPTMAQIVAYQTPETVANSLDPAQPANATITVQAAFDSTCGDAATASVTASNVATAVPDLDLTVTPSPMQLVAAQAPYLYIFDYRITNNGATGSVAERIQFRIPHVGADWASVSATLLTPGAGGSVVTTTNAGNAYLISAANLGTLAVGQSAVVRVTATTAAFNANGPGTPAAANLALVGEVEGSLFNQSAADTGVNYSLDRAAPIIADDFTVSGYVYRDANHDGNRDTGETGLGVAPPAVSPLYAKLVNTAAPAAAIAAVSVDSTTGYYEFTHSAGPGTYKIIIDDNNTLADVAPTTLLSSYIGTEMPGLVRTVVVGVTSVYNQNFGLFLGAKLTGTVFKDTGAGTSANANNGVQDPPEPGLANVAVRAANPAGTVVHDSALTDGDGRYTLWVPAGAALRVLETNLTGYVSTGGSPGGSGGAYSLAGDHIAFTPTAGATYTGLDFADVPPNAFLTDGRQTVLPGATVTYPHTFVAGTAGSVSFNASVTGVSPSNLNAWSHLVQLDVNGNGLVDDPADILLAPGDTIPVDAGGEVRIVIKQFAPVGAPSDARNTITVTATFTAAAGQFPELARQDLTLIGVEGGAALDLVKAVDVNTALPGAVITYTITYLNNGTEPLKNVQIHDQVPAFTRFLTATANTPAGNGLAIDLGIPPADFNTSGISRPAINAASGAIIWRFSGELIPGGTGTVSFTVQVAPVGP